MAAECNVKSTTSRTLGEMYSTTWDEGNSSPTAATARLNKDSELNHLVLSIRRLNEAGNHGNVFDYFIRQTTALPGSHLMKV